MIYKWGKPNDMLIHGNYLIEYPENLYKNNTIKFLNLTTRAEKRITLNYPLFWNNLEAHCGRFYIDSDDVIFSFNLKDDSFVEIPVTCPTGAYHIHEEK